MEKAQDGTKEVPNAEQLVCLISMVKTLFQHQLYRAANAPVYVFLEFFIPVLGTIFFPSRWLLFSNHRRSNGQRRERNDSRRSDYHLSHNNACFLCNIAITNFPVSHTCEIIFNDVIGRSTVPLFTL